VIESGTRLGPYTVIGRLGAGGMGDVYRARDERLGRDVALKLLPPEFASSPLRLSLFRREALTLAALNHPGIAVIHGIEEPEPGTVFLVLELVEGDSLAARVARGPLPVEEALRISLKVAEALEAAHERGVIHRDLKPANIMIGPKGVVKVLDFGLARRLGSLRAPSASSPETYPEPPEPPVPDTDLPGNEDATLVGPLPGTEPAAGPAPAGSEDATFIAPGNPVTPEDATLVAPGDPPPPGDATLVTGGSSSSQLSSLEELSALDDDVAGTPGYMSPEQILGRPQDARTDVFAFGVILYETLTGQAPFRQREVPLTLAATVKRPADLSRLPERTPLRVVDLVAASLEKEPARRPPDMKTVRQELEDVLDIRRASALLAGEAPRETAGNLPPELPPLLGREDELEAGAARLREGRLVTLTGMGGTGKTLLARHLGRTAGAAHPDGVWFVDLAPVVDAERVTMAVSLALDVREEPGRSVLDTLAAHLAPRTTLLILDNCEQVREAAAGLSRMLLASSPGLRILATSREALGVDEEVTLPVPPLAVPEEGSTRVGSSPAVRLFAERARQARPGFELTAENAAAVGDICRQLDGIPLALELAAARVKVLGVEQIRSKLENRFRLLTGGTRSALPHQQTLRATMQWSYDALDPEEQTLFRTLSVFLGGWTLESATAVSGDDADEFEILDVLTRLIEKSLVVVQDGDEDNARYRYLETVRQYAGEMREGAGEGAALRSRHVAYFLGLVETSETQLVGPGQAGWLARLDAEHPNLLAALRACFTLEGSPTEGLRLASAAARYWSVRGLVEVGEKALRSAVDSPEASAHTPERAKALVRLGGMALYRNRPDDARGPIEGSLALYRELGDGKGTARALSGLATVATYQGDYATARKANEEVLAAYRAEKNVRGQAVTLHNLGFLSSCEGDAGGAAEWFAKALPLLREVGDLSHIALTTADLGIALTRAGDLRGAADRLAESLKLGTEVGAVRETAYAVEGTAELALARGAADRAAVWHAAASAQRETTGISLSPAEKDQRERFLTALRNTLGEEVYGLCRDEGTGSDFPGIVAATLAWTTGPGRGY